MHLQYNTNGLAHHRLEDALRVLADLGYDGVALTPDVAHLDLLHCGEGEWQKCRALLDRLHLSCSIETGARFSLDPFRKHWPSLMTVDDCAAARRLDFYARACDLASALGARVVSIFSGVLTEKVPRDHAFALLVGRLQRVLDIAAGNSVQICLEPEPSMFIESLKDLGELRARISRSDLYTTIDVGHLLVTEEGEPHVHLRSVRDHLRHVQLDDARRGVHEHLQIGEGEIDFRRVLGELAAIGYSGALAVELSRDSHRAVDAARTARERLLSLSSQVL